MFAARRVSAVVGWTVVHFRLFGGRSVLTRLGGRLGRRGSFAGAVDLRGHALLSGHVFSRIIALRGHSDISDSFSKAWIINDSRARFKSHK